MNTFNFIDTKFLAINGNLSNIVTGGTAMLTSNFYKESKKYIIKAKLPTTDTEFLSVELLGDQIIISSSVQTLSNSGIVFNMPFGAKTFKVPKGVNQEKIEAHEKDGFLIVELPISTTNSRDRSNIDINFDDDF